MRFLVYSDATGEVLRTGNCPDEEHALMQAGNGETAITDPDEGISADGRWRFVDDGFIQDDLPAPTVNQLKIYASDKASSLIGEMKSYVVGQTEIKSDCASGTLANWIALQQWAQISPQNTTTWVANDLTTAQLPAAAVSAIAVAVGNRAGTIYNILGSVLDGIDAEEITTTEDIDAVSWPA